MAYHISVRTRGGEGEPSRELYQNPLGTGTQLWQYWLRPAGDLGLTFLCGRFDDGLKVSGPDLHRLASDLDTLERHWIQAHIGATEQVRFSKTHEDGSRTEGTLPMHDHLRQRLEYLREAIRIAQEADAVLSVG